MGIIAHTRSVFVCAWVRDWVDAHFPYCTNNVYYWDCDWFQEGFCISADMSADANGHPHRVDIIYCSFRCVRTMDGELKIHTYICLLMRLSALDTVRGTVWIRYAASPTSHPEFVSLPLDLPSLRFTTNTDQVLPHTYHNNTQCMCRAKLHPTTSIVRSLYPMACVCCVHIAQQCSWMFYRNIFGRFAIMQRCCPKGISLCFWLGILPGSEQNAVIVPWLRAADPRPSNMKWKFH